MAATLTRLTHKIAMQLHLKAESRIICSSRSRRPVRELLDAPSYVFSFINGGKPVRSLAPFPWHQILNIWHDTYRYKYFYIFVSEISPLATLESPAACGFTATRLEIQNIPTLHYTK
jgi:hypothetical protein